MNEAYLDALFLATIGIAFMIRAYPLLRLRLKNVDNYYHLLAARQVWKEKQLPMHLNGFLFEGTYSYPPLFHLLLSPLVGKFSSRSETIAFLIAPALDVLTAVSMYLVVGAIIGQLVALVSVILYVVTPLLVIESLPMSPRTLGAFFLNLLMLLLFFFSYDHNYWLLIPASVVCIPVVLLSHKMASQSLLFVQISSLVVFALIDPAISVFQIASLVIGISFTFLVSKGFYRRVVRGHKAMLLYHFRHGNYRGEKKYGSPLQIVQRLPWIVIMLPAAFFAAFSRTLLPDVLVPLTWGSFFILLTLIWRYGDNYRYLVYAVAPLSIVFASLILTLPSEWLVLAIALSVAISAVRLGIFFFRRLKNEPLITDELLNCLGFIRNQHTHASLGCVPVSLNYPSAFYTEKSVLGAEAAPEPWEKGEDFSTFYRDEGLLGELISKYGTKLFLVNCADPFGANFESLLKNSRQFVSQVLHSSGHFKVYELSANIK